MVNGKMDNRYRRGVKTFSVKSFFYLKCDGSVVRSYGERVISLLDFTLFLHNPLTILLGFVQD